MLTAVFCLLYVAAICTLGIFSRAYRDNLLQQWGLVLTSLACIGMVPHVMQFYVMALPCALMLGGLVSFGTGTLMKVIHFNRKHHATGRAKRETA